MNQIKALLRAFSEHPVAYFPVFAEVTGSVTAGVLLAQVFYWWYDLGEREFYKTDQEFANDLGMGLYELRAAKKRLVEKKLINITMKGLPRRSYYTFHESRLVELIASVRKNPTLELEETEHKSEQKPNPIAETTQETTQKGNMQRTKTALRTKRKTLRGLSKEEVINLYRSSPEKPPKGYTRPQMLAGVLDHVPGMEQIVERYGWRNVMLRLGQLFNGHRKVHLQYSDLMESAIEMERIPVPRNSSPSLDYLIAALSGAAQNRMIERFEENAEAYKTRISEQEIIDDIAGHLRLSR